MDKHKEHKTAIHGMQHYSKVNRNEWSKDTCSNVADLRNIVLSDGDGMHQMACSNSIYEKYPEMEMTWRQMQIMVVGGWGEGRKRL